MTDDSAQREAATGTAGNAPADVGAAETHLERTAAVDAFADSGGSSLSREDLKHLDDPAPGSATGAAGTGTIGDTPGGAGLAGTYTAAGTSAPGGGGAGAAQSPVTASPTGGATAQAGVEGPIAGRGGDVTPGGSGDDADDDER